MPPLPAEAAPAPDDAPDVPPDPLEVDTPLLASDVPPGPLEVDAPPLAPDVPPGPLEVDAPPLAPDVPPGPLDVVAPELGVVPIPDAKPSPPFGKPPTIVSRFFHGTRTATGAQTISEAEEYLS